MREFPVVFQLPLQEAKAAPRHQTTREGGSTPLSPWVVFVGLIALASFILGMVFGDPLYDFAKDNPLCRISSSDEERLFVKLEDGNKTRKIQACEEIRQRAFYASARQEIERKVLDLYLYDSNREVREAAEKALISIVSKRDLSSNINQAEETFERSLLAIRIKFLDELRLRNYKSLYDVPTESELAFLSNCIEDCDELKKFAAELAATFMSQDDRALSALLPSLVRSNSLYVLKRDPKNAEIKERECFADTARNILHILAWQEELDPFEAAGALSLISNIGELSFTGQRILERSLKDSLYRQDGLNTIVTLGPKAKEIRPVLVSVEGSLKTYERPSFEEALKAISELEDSQ